MVQLYVYVQDGTISQSALNILLTGVTGVISSETVRDLKTGTPRNYALVRVADEPAESVIAHLNAEEVDSSPVHASRMPLTLPDEMSVRDYLQTYTPEVLSAVGIKYGHQVLDYGCGPGIFTIPCAKIVGEQGKVYALDVEETALSRIKERAVAESLGNIVTLLQNSGSIAISISANSFDFVLIYDVLHDIADKPALIEEMHRILKPDGVLSIFPMHWGNEPLLKLMVEQGLFELRDNFVPPNNISPSYILNFNKYR